MVTEVLSTGQVQQFIVSDGRMYKFFEGSINQQLKAFLDGFYEIIPKHLISIFNEQELELLISGLPNVDIDDLYTNTEYKTYTKSSPQVPNFNSTSFTSIIECTDARDAYSGY